jgi:glycosyltransferase involved in cell wall biosynthesis
MLGRAAIATARRLNLPVVFTFHTLYWEHAHYVPLPLGENCIRKLIERQVANFLNSCDRVIVYTEDLKEMLHSRFGLKDTVSVVPTGIDLVPYQYNVREEMRAKWGWGKHTVLISVGRLGREKSWHTLLDAGIRAMTAFPFLRIVIIGDGPERKSLQEYVEHRGFRDCVTFLGKIPFEEVPYYLQAADIFGFASITETMGRATIEAIAAGLPVVAVNAPGTSTIIEHDREGLLTSNDASALADALCILLRDESLRMRYSLAGREKAKKFRLELEAAMTLAVYKQAITERKDCY